MSGQGSVPVAGRFENTVSSLSTLPESAGRQGTLAIARKASVGACTKIKRHRLPCAEASLSARRGLLVVGLCANHVGPGAVAPWLRGPLHRSGLTAQRRSDTIIGHGECRRVGANVDAVAGLDLTPTPGEAGSGAASPLSEK